MPGSLSRPRACSFRSSRSFPRAMGTSPSRSLASRFRENRSRSYCYWSAQKASGRSNSGSSKMASARAIRDSTAFPAQASSTRCATSCPSRMSGLGEKPLASREKRAGVLLDRTGIDLSHQPNAQAVRAGAQKHRSLRQLHDGRRVTRGERTTTCEHGLAVARPLERDQIETVARAGESYLGRIARRQLKWIRECARGHTCP